MAFIDVIKEENGALFQAAPPLDDMLDGTCTIINVAAGTDDERDGWGNIAKQDIILVSNLQCEIQPNTSFSRFEEFYQTRQGVTHDHVAYIKVRDNDLDISFIPTARYRITNYVKDGIAQGFEYDISAVLQDGGGTRHWFLGCNVVAK